MKWVLLVPILLALAVACATGGGGADRSPKALSWPPGAFGLEGSISYRTDLTRTDTIQYRAELDISPDGSLQLESSSGACRDPLPPEAAQDQSRGRRSFRCGEVTFLLQPAGGTIRGEIVVLLQEAVRGPRTCTEYREVRGERVCAAYSSGVDYRQTAKRVRLRIVPRALSRQDGRVWPPSSPPSGASSIPRPQFSSG